MQLHIDHIALPSPPDSAAPCVPWAPGFSSGKREPRGLTRPSRIMGHFARAPTLISHHGTAGNLRASAIGNPWLRSRGTGLAISPQVLADRVYTYSAQVTVPTSRFVYLQNQIRGTFWWGNPAGCRSAWFGHLPMEVLPSLELSSPMSKRGAES